MDKIGNSFPDYEAICDEEIIKRYDQVGQISQQISDNISLIELDPIKEINQISEMN